MKVTWINGEINRSAIIEVPEATDWHLMEAFAQTTDFLTGGTPQASVEAHPVQVQVQAPHIELQIKKETERPHTYPKVNSPEERMSTPLADLLEAKVAEMLATVKPQAEQAEGPEHWKTGIQTYEGVKRYRTRYVCKDLNCQNKGRRYIPEGAPYVLCHACKTKLKVRPAHPDGFPTQDDFGNFYVADELYVEDTLGPQNNEPISAPEADLTPSE